MRTTTVTRHYCDHCRKGKFHKSAMVRHEAICYHNPKRACYRCERSETDVQENAEFLAANGVEKLSDHVGFCPDCILAAHVWYNTRICHDDADFLRFDYKPARDEWDRENEIQPGFRPVP